MAMLRKEKRFYAALTSIRHTSLPSMTCLWDHSVLTLKNLHKPAHKYKLVCILEPCFINKRKTDHDLKIPMSSTKKEVLFYQQPKESLKLPWKLSLLQTTDFLFDLHLLLCSVTTLDILIQWFTPEKLFIKRWGKGKFNNTYDHSESNCSL